MSSIICSCRFRTRYQHGRAIPAARQFHRSPASSTATTRCGGARYRGGPLARQKRFQAAASRRGRPRPQISRSLTASSIPTGIQGMNERAGRVSRSPLPVEFFTGNRRDDKGERAKIEKEISIDLQKDKGTVNSSICFALDQAATAATLCQHRQRRPRPSASDALPNEVPAVGLVLESDGPVAPRPHKSEKANQLAGRGTLSHPSGI
jgi:hypothetical protein